MKKKPIDMTFEEFIASLEKEKKIDKKQILEFKEKTYLAFLTYKEILSSQVDKLRMRDIFNYFLLFKQIDEKLQKLQGAMRGGQGGQWSNVFTNTELIEKIRRGELPS